LRALHRSRDRRNHTEAAVSRTMFGAAVSQQLRILAASSEECQSRSNEGGDFIYIKPGVPHEVFNMSDTESVVAFVARSSADEWNNMVPYDRTQPG
jgi:uncharacterized RmlC-like cupin family protein